MSSRCIIHTLRDFESGSYKKDMVVVGSSEVEDDISCTTFMLFSESIWTRECGTLNGHMRIIVWNR